VTRQDEEISKKEEEIKKVRVEYDKQIIQYKELFGIALGHSKSREAIPNNSPNNYNTN
jgi:hypothetical protein